MEFCRIMMLLSKYGACLTHRSVATTLVPSCPKAATHLVDIRLRLSDIGQDLFGCRGDKKDAGSYPISNGKDSWLKSWPSGMKIEKWIGLKIALFIQNVSKEWKFIQHTMVWLSCARQGASLFKSSLCTSPPSISCNIKGGGFSRAIYEKLIYSLTT